MSRKPRIATGYAVHRCECDALDCQRIAIALGTETEPFAVGFFTPEAAKQLAADIIALLPSQGSLPH